LVEESVQRAIILKGKERFSRRRFGRLEE